MFVPVLLYYYTVNGYYSDSWSGVLISKNTVIIHVSLKKAVVKVGPPVHNYEHEAGSYGDGFT